jgi:hypothetical protein
LESETSVDDSEFEKDDMITMNHENDAYEMTKMIADSSPEKRQSLLTDRLKMLASQPEEERTMSVKGMVVGMYKLDEKRRSVFQCALAEALTKRTEKEREAIYIGRAKAGLLVSKEVDNEVYQGIVNEIYNWPEERRSMILGDIEKAHDKLKLSKPDFQYMIDKAKAAA